MDVKKVISEYLPGVVHMSLATCVDNKPWVCEVHYVYDDDFNLYWRSKESTRHSQEIAINPFVAGNIIEPHRLTDKPRGVYFEGRAEKITGVTVGDTIYTLFAERFGLTPEIVDDANGEDGHRFYKVNVSDIYLFDTRESKPGQKYHLDK